MSSWHSPQSIFSISHKILKKAEFFEQELQAQEKVDGSFFACGKYLVDFDDPNSGYALRMRSKGAVIEPDAPPAMFKGAVDYIKSIEANLTPNWQYRGEVLSKAKHNALAYDRVPAHNFILFDVLKDEEDYLSYQELAAEAFRLGLEVVPQLFVGKVKEAIDLRKFLEITSILGGQLIEGIVLKPITAIYGMDKKLLMAKFVSESFKEVHKKAWSESNPSTSDIILKLGAAYASQARWQKSLIHLREEGKILDLPKDIGLLVPSVLEDILKEEEENIKDILFDYAWPNLKRLVTKGLAEWYKDLLLTQTFEKEAGLEAVPGTVGDWAV